MAPPEPDKMTFLFQIQKFKVTLKKKKKLKKPQTANFDAKIVHNRGPLVNCRIRSNESLNTTFIKLQKSKTIPIPST